MAEDLKKANKAYEDMLKEYNWKTRADLYLAFLKGYMSGADIKTNQ